MSQYDQLDQLTAKLHPTGVLHIQLNKPKILNAVGEAVWRQYAKAFEYAMTDPDVLVVIVSGVGRAFCAGLDLKSSGDIISEEASKIETARRGLRTLSFIKQFQDAIKTSYDLKKPVIGVAHGISYGLAIDMLSNVDIRFATKDTRFSVREIAIGMAADIGSLQQLPKIVGNHSWIREIVYTGREFSGQEALEKGFVSRVFDTQEETLKAAFQLAEEIAEKSPIALYGCKSSLNYANDHTLQEGLDRIAEFNSLAIENDLRVGIQATLMKQKPKYSKL